MKYARIVSAVVQEVIDFNPAGRFAPEVAALFIPCPDNIVAGWSYAGSNFVAPPAPAPAPAQAPAPKPLLTPMQFYLAFTPDERIAIKTNLDEFVKEFWDTFTLARQTDTPIDPNLRSVTNALGYLAGMSDPPLSTPCIRADRIPDILAGKPQ